MSVRGLLFCLYYSFIHLLWWALQMLLQRLLRAGGRHQPGGDELPRGGLPVRHRLRPQRHARRLRLLLRRATERDGLPGRRARAPRRGAPKAALLLRSCVHSCCRWEQEGVADAEPPHLEKPQRSEILPKP
jgi:hypothetical protein